MYRSISPVRTATSTGTSSQTVSYGLSTPNETLGSQYPAVLASAEMSWWLGRLDNLLERGLEVVC